MQPISCGRFCGTCQKTVIDFTGYSDEAFIAYFQQTATIPCGRFTPHQLKLPLQTPRKRLPAWLHMSNKYIAAVFLSLAGLPTKMYSQVVRTEQEPSKAQQSKASTGSWVHIKGLILDDNGDGIPGAAIILDSISTVTDMDGNFELIIPATQQWPVYLSIQSLFTIDTVVQVNDSAIRDNRTLNIRIHQDAGTLMGDIVIIQRRGIWHRLTKPFRRKR